MKVEAEYNLDLTDFFAKMGQVSDTLGKVEDTIKRQASLNPLARYAERQNQYNQALGLQIQIYQRSQAAANSFRAEQKRLEEQYKDLKSRQLEFMAAGRYSELKANIAQVETALKRMNSPLVEADSWWDKLKAKFAQGLKVKVDTPVLPGIPTPAASNRDERGRFLPGSGKGGMLKNVAGAAVDELAGAAGLSLSAAGAVAAVGAVIVKSTQEWAEYGKKLSEVSAITGATGKALEFLDDQALQIEADTGIAGTTILDAFKSIGSIKPDLLESNEALAQTTKEVIALSQASGLDLQQAAISLLGSINQFGEAADQAGRFANVLAAGAKFGASEINETSEALKNSGTAMKAAGVSFEQGNALVQSLAGVMIKGSEAGTALRNVLLKLETASDKNLRPSVVGLDAALENASKKYTTTTDLTKAFGVENIVAARRILDTRTEITKLTKDITGTSVAYEQAKTNTDNLSTDLSKAGSAITAFFRALGESQDGTLRTIIQGFTNFVNSVSSKTGVLRAFFSEVFSVQGLISPGVGIANGIKAAYEQRQANLKAEARKQLVDGITAGAVKSVSDETKKLEQAYQQQGLTVPKAQRAAAAKQKEVRAEEYQSARDDHNRLRKEYERASVSEKAQYDKRFAESRKRILAAQVAKKKADGEVARLDKADADRAEALKSALGEKPTDEQKKTGEKAQKIRDEQNRLLLEAQEEYAKEAQKLEQDYGKERLEALDKNGQQYINAKADIEQKALQIERDALEKRLQLAKSDKTAVINGKRQVVADKSITLENSAPEIAQIFADKQKQIEDDRARQVELSRIRQEYRLLELARQSNETELQLFDKQWEEKILVEKKNTERLESLKKQHEAAQVIIRANGSKQEIEQFEEAWERIFAEEKKNSEVYDALIAKRKRDRNTLVVNQLLDQTRKQEGIELAYVDTDRFAEDQFEKDLSFTPTELARKREEEKLRIRRKYAEDTIALLREQGESENALLITQTEAAIDAIKKQQAQLLLNSPKYGSIYDLLGITKGMDELDLAAFETGMQRIGEAIQNTTQLLIEQSDQKIQALDAQIQAKEEQIRIEEERDKEGQANNLAIRKFELDSLKKQKKEEEDTKRKSQAVQSALDLATLVSNNALSVSNTIAAITGAAKAGIQLGPIAGPIAIVGIIATIVSTLFAAKAKLKTIAMREGGRLQGPKHEHGGIPGTGRFADIEVEGGEHVTNAKSSERFDQTLESLNKNDPQQALRALVREGGFGLPPAVIHHIRQPGFGVQNPADQAASREMTGLKEELREQKEVTKKMAKDIARLANRKTITPLANGGYIETDGDGNQHTYKP